MNSLWMHGLGKAPQTAVKKLKDLGFGSVVCSPKEVPLVRAKNMDAYVCTGAYRGPDFQDESWLCLDHESKRQRWFSSTCPTRKEVRDYNLKCIFELAKTPGIRGILIDGARFSSPISGKDYRSFFTCFCPSCTEKMKSLGYDPEALKKAVSVLAHYTEQKASLEEVLSYKGELKEWLSFRREATTEHLIDFVKTVKAVNSEIQCGIYIFSPSLSDLVGQSYEDLKDHMDFFAPMIYRCYQDPNGPACLNTELAALSQMIEDAGTDDQERAKLLSGLTGLSIQKDENHRTLLKGLPIEVIQTEVKRAKERVGTKPVIPILQLDDPALESAIEQAKSGGADNVNFFVYDDKIVDRIVDTMLLKKSRQA